MSSSSPGYSSAKRFAASCAVVVATLSIECAKLAPGGLTVLGGERYVYECAGGTRIEARYFRLSDGSLNFVKLVMSDGRTYTLPNVVSGSGARFTDDRELVWWVKGDSAFVQTRGPNGEWVISTPNCGILRKTK
jgi:membrane-bound inhibitor of C-type lysozyme